MSYALLFPGQGSQSVGMGGDLFDAHPDLLGDAADDVLGWSLRSMCLDGPEEALTQTEHAQPALFSVSFALWVSLKERLDMMPAGAAGHSLGEYTALAAAGSFSFLEGLRLVAARGRAMASAAALEASGMAALIGVDGETAENIAATRRSDGGNLWVANINAPGQIVVAGGSTDIEWVVAEARDLGVRRAVSLKVAGAFHSPYMKPAGSDLTEALRAVTITAPAFPVWANVTGEPHDAAPAAALVEQLTGTVRFSESLEAMARSGIETFVHVGPGDVTAGLAKRSVEGTEPVVVSSLEDVDAAAQRLAAA